MATPSSLHLALVWALSPVSNKASDLNIVCCVPKSTNVSVLVGSIDIELSSEAGQSPSDFAQNLPVSRVAQ